MSEFYFNLNLYRILILSSHFTILMDLVLLTTRSSHKLFSLSQVKEEALVEDNQDHPPPEVPETQRLLLNNFRLSSPPEELEV